jgi:putative transposase
VFRRGRSSVFLLNIHLVFVTKHCRQILNRKVLNSLSDHFAEICSGLNCDLEECEGESDHVHLVVSMAPTVSVSSLVNALKGASSRIIRKEVLNLGPKKALWSPSYFAFSTGDVPLEHVKKYVHNQCKEAGFPLSPKGEGFQPKN